MNNLIKNALTWPEKAVVCVYNPIKRKCLVVYSTNVTSYVLRLIQELRDGTYVNREMVADRDQLEIEFVEDCSKLMLNFVGQYKAYHWAQRLRETRGEFYTPPKEVKIKTKIDVNYNTTEMYYQLQGFVVTGRGVKYSVGLFPDMRSAKAYFRWNDINTILETVDQYYREDMVMEEIKGIYD